MEGNLKVYYLQMLSCQHS